MLQYGSVVLPKGQQTAARSGAGACVNRVNVEPVGYVEPQAESTGVVVELCQGRRHRA